MLTNDEKRTVAAVLRTQAAMQDHRVLDGMKVLARLVNDEPRSELTAMMREDIEVIETDSDELSRLASKIEATITP